MNFKSLTILYFLSILLIACKAEIEREESISVAKVTVNYFNNPLGIDDLEPRITWTMSSNLRNKQQSAYQIKVASSQQALNHVEDLLWDTGKTVSNQNSNVRYKGKALKSGQQYYFQIKVWDESDVASKWSKISFWTMGLLDKNDWKAKWIGYKTNDNDKNDPLHLPGAPYLRKSFSLKENVKKASLYVSSLGVFEMSVNGKNIGDDILTPGWTDYNKRVYYKTYDISKDLIQGKNALGAIIADGWYAGYVGPKELSNPRNRELYGLHPALLCQLEIEYENGAKEVIVSDKSWKAKEGPWVYADLLMGTGYNANLELPNWNTQGFDDQNWESAFLHEGTQGELQAYPGNTIQVYDELVPIKITEPKSGTFIFNMGQNFAGHSRLKINGTKNDSIIIRYGERLHDDGTLMTENLRFARATDTYILKGKGLETWEPKFTYHGFQYVEVTGLKTKPNKNTMTGIAFGSATPMTSSFTSSDETLNRMFENVVWTQRSNFMDVPTDSPQRDERLGWLGDVQIFSKSALYNANLASFNAKWLTDVRDAQYDFGAYSTFAPRPYPKLVWYSPGWMEAGVMVPYNTYKFYGDTKIIEDHYESMTQFMDYHIEKSKKVKFYPENSWTEVNPKGGFGDWLEMTDKHTAHDIMASLYYQNVLKMMAEMSTAIGNEDKAIYYQSTYDESVAAFIDHYINKDGKFEIDESAYGDGKGYFEGEKGFTGHSQSAYATALYFDVLPDELKAKAGKQLVELIEQNNNLPSSGILGIRQLLPALSAIDRSDLAYGILLNKEYPSWGFQIKNGATTIWERWNSYTPEQGFNGAMNAKMNSFNHYAFGAYSQYLFSGLAGIDTEGAGFKNIIVRPDLGDYSLTNVNGEYESINGKIVSSWTIKDSTYTLKVEIPVNTQAKVYVPTKNDGEITESGKPINSENVIFLENEGNYKVFTVFSGSYLFESKL